ncbi:MAG TPA: HD domain-containing phosphohydrolase [Solirubrobacterales bacterium]|jgi:putative nucleotidyltransferase with HDIG domain
MQTAAPLKTNRELHWPPAGRVETQLERRARLLEASVPGMRGHSSRVAVYAALTAQRIGLDRVAVTQVRRGAALHDIGKAEVPVEMLGSPRPLVDEELATVQEHVIAGARIVSSLGDEELTAIVRHHHERFDGDGYPDGLIGEEIPIGARIVAVADTFDAATSERPYRPALTHPQALDMLDAIAGSQLDPEVVAVFRVHCSGLRGALEAVQQG